MKTFVIQGKSANGHFIPAQSHGYTTIEAIEYANWFQREQIYDYVLTDNLHFRTSGIGAPEGIDYNYLRPNYIPIGSVEFVLAWLKLMGVEEVKPLNIPQELWRFCEREIRYVDNLMELDGKWMIKDRNRIKNCYNGGLRLPQNIQGNYFATKWIDDVVSEWRIFVLDKKVRGVRCYSGDEWIMPSRDYINAVVDAYDNRCHTLDVMVCERETYPVMSVGDTYAYKTKYRTEIIELHDFFATGLYGFEDYTVLPRMWITTINELLKERK